MSGLGMLFACQKAFEVDSELVVAYVLVDLLDCSEGIRSCAPGRRESGTSRQCTMIGTGQSGAGLLGKLEGANDCGIRFQW